MGVFRYKCMEFVLSSAPGCFQKIMSLILHVAGIPGVPIYLNNVVVHTPSTMLHNARLQQLFKQFKHHRVTLNAEKSTLGSRRLSSFVSGSPKRASPNHIPQTPSPLSSFLGMATPAAPSSSLGTAGALRWHPGPRASQTCRNPPPPPHSKDEGPICMAQ